MVWAWLASYQISGSEFDLEMVNAWMNWFEGDNIASSKMYDSNDMKCYDGINFEGINYHSGAESNICLLLSKYMVSNLVTI